MVSIVHQIVHRALHYLVPHHIHCTAASSVLFPRLSRLAFLFPSSSTSLRAMSTFAGNEKWRNHPALRVRVRHLFPGFMYGLAAVVVVSAVEMLLPAEAGHGAHAAGEKGQQTSAAKSTGEGSHGVH